MVFPPPIPQNVGCEDFCEANLKPVDQPGSFEPGITECISDCSVVYQHDTKCDKQMSLVCGQTPELKPSSRAEVSSSKLPEGSHDVIDRHVVKNIHVSKSSNDFPELEVACCINETGAACVSDGSSGHGEDTGSVPPGDLPATGESAPLRGEKEDGSVRSSRGDLPPDGATPGGSNETRPDPGQCRRQESRDREHQVTGVTRGSLPNSATGQTPQKKLKKRRKKKPNITKEEYEKMKSEVEDMKASYTCKVCLEEEVNRAFLPCGHLVCCNVCSEKLRDCPMCRARIIALVKVSLR